MDAIARLTDKDIERLNKIRDILHEIDCISVSCTICPLYFEHKGCLCNYLGYISRKAELERRTSHDN